ncbi:MAG: hypothetical protein ACI4QM_02680 [Alphaproteobacteria bacterium]
MKFICAALTVLFVSGAVMACDCDKKVNTCGCDKSADCSCD